MKKKEIKKLQKGIEHFCEGFRRYTEFESQIKEKSNNQISEKSEKIIVIEEIL